ncbi:hypothetical protein [Treponema primitia]|uniref:hypothetical protein n=1 Tax=Treponema primitia TaxID=88058 RepID=UPI00145FB151|nr:hypothetical protein [Treponema primitia]
MKNITTEFTDHRDKEGGKGEEEEEEEEIYHEGHQAAFYCEPCSGMFWLRFREPCKIRYISTRLFSSSTL